MCSIGGVFSKQGKDVFPLLLDLLFSQCHRGEEGFGISVKGKTVKSQKLLELQKNFLSGSFGVCHSLLSITGHEIQPVQSENKNFALVHNGQVYNFKELSGTKSFSGSNDSKAIACFLGKKPQKKVFSFMKKAVGTFAVGLCEKNSVSAFRDFVGIKPLWFGENSEVFAFASEPLALKKLNIAFPKPLLPGHLISFSKKGVSEKKVFDLNDFRKTIPKSSNIENLFNAFLQSVDYRTNGLKECGVFFSGGIDSSVIAKSVCERVPNATLFTAGISGSPDISFSDRAAGALGLKLVVCEIQKDELPMLSNRIMRSMCFFDLMQLGIALPIFVCAKKAKENGLKVVFSGQGSDEIFCGYSAYQKILRSEGGKAVKEKVWSALLDMWSRNLFREDIVSMQFSLEHRLPFLDTNFLREAMALPLKEKISGASDELRKHAVRKIGKKLGLPEFIIERRKKAVQYGSGVQKELEKMF